MPMPPPGHTFPGGLTGVVVSGIPAVTLDTTGALLEGIRISTGNSPFGFPPRSLVTDPAAFGAIQNAAEYMVAAIHPSAFGTDIADPDLAFYWSRNEGTVTRFDYDSFGRRWNTQPGAPPTNLGVISNSPRLKAPVPDSTVPSSPYSLYIGTPTRLITFTISVVESPADFTDPAAGIVQISKSTSELNFGTADLNNPSYAGQSVFLTRQTFFDRKKTSGAIGTLPEAATGTYEIFLNPIPGTGQFPRVRIDFRPYLIPIAVPNEASFTTPASGTFQWSEDTGKIKLSPADVAQFLTETVYYDGVFVGRFQLTQVSLGAAGGSFPAQAFTVTAFIGNTDPQRFCVFSTHGGIRTYFQVTIGNSATGPLTGPFDGDVLIDQATGNLYMTSGDVSQFGSAMHYVDSVATIENGVGVQFYRSGVNTSGVEIEPDFVIRYLVTQQVIVDGIMQVPFVMLPTIPIVDSTLSYNIDAGPGATGTFVGNLVSAIDPTAPGFGYELDLSARKLNFSNRKTVTITLDRDSLTVKLADPVIFLEGFQITKNGNPITPGIDFDFNANAGLLEFIQPVGENDPGNIIGISGTFTLPSTFTTTTSPFSISNIGAYLFVPTGLNAGIYRIVSFINSHTVVVDTPFVAAGSGVADLRLEAEIVADRFWQDFIPPYKKFSISRINASGTFPLATTDFSVLATTGQVNLVTPALPNDTFQVSYISLDSPDNGVTVTPTNRTEFAAFKVRQETATISANSPMVRINPSGKTVDTAHPIVVYVDGVTQDSGTFTFTAPGTVTLNHPLVGTEQVVIDYWIREATGGETNFNLLFTPLDIDFPTITAGQNTAVFNGDQLSILEPGGAFLIDGKEVVIISVVTYSLIGNVTTVTFEETPTISTQSNSKLQVTQSITGSYRITESAMADPIAKNTNTLTVAGNVPYVAGTVITINEDPYLVTAAKFDPTTGKTSVMTAGPAKFNYIIPRITRTIRPVLQPGASFQTSELANMSFPFTLVIGGSQRRVLVSGVDYNVGEGGVITLKEQLISGEILYALYVGRVTQPAGTVFVLNYANGIAPDDINGIKGQRLNSTYDLFAPDTFFFRVETVPSFLSEVIQELQKSATTGGASGPNTSSASSLQTKDFGSPGLYFDEQHLGNLDAVLARLLKFYNDLANHYEDLLADYDGRVVGGQSGRLRFDGNLNNPPRNSYAQVTNDIDDQILLYQTSVLTGFFTFDNIPVYGFMWQANNFSRFFPTLETVTAALNGSTGIFNFGKTLGSLNVSNITSTSTLSSTPAISKILSIDSTGQFLTIATSGNAPELIPAFASGQKIQLYFPNGTPDIETTISAVTGTGPFVLQIGAVTGLIGEGVIAQDTSDPSISGNNFYTPGRDILVNNDNGQLTNISLSLPFPLNNIQVPIVGNELINATVTFQNSDTTPKRFPALDGLTTNDAGFFSAPPVFYTNEIDSLVSEIIAINGVVTGSDASLTNQVTLNTGFANVGDKISITSGPNTGQSAIVTAIVSVGPPEIVTVAPAFGSLSAGPDAMLITPAHNLPITQILAQEIGLVSTNVAAIPPVGAQLGVLNSELNSILLIAASFGPVLTSGTGTVTSTVLTDSLNNFATANVQISSFVLIVSGPNIGLYKISSFTTTTITVSTIAPFNGFASPGAVQYFIIQPWAFLSSKESAFINPPIQKNLAYVASTQAWAGSIGVAGVIARLAVIAGRQGDISQFIRTVSGLLGKDDKIYDNRYLWITSRIDKKTGTLVRQSQAMSKRLDATTKLLADQQKLLIANQLTG